jgi:hypothetical protein
VVAAGEGLVSAGVVARGEGVGIGAAVVWITAGAVATGAGVVAVGVRVVTVAAGAVGVGEVVPEVEVVLHDVAATPNMTRPIRNFLMYLLLLSFDEYAQLLSRPL